MAKLDLAAMIITLSYTEVREAITEWLEKRNLRPADIKTLPLEYDRDTGLEAFKFKVEAIEVKQGPYR